MMQLPPMPPAPAPKKKNARPVLFIVGGLLLFGVISNAMDGSPENPSEAPLVESVPDVELARMQAAWDLMPASDREALCDYYNIPPRGLTPDLIEVFVSETDLSYEEADRLLEAVLSEEC